MPSTAMSVRARRVKVGGPVQCCPLGAPGLRKLVTAKVAAYLAQASAGDWWPYITDHIQVNVEHDTLHSQSALTLCVICCLGFSTYEILLQGQCGSLPGRIAQSRFVFVLTDRWSVHQDPRFHAS